MENKNGKQAAIVRLNEQNPFFEVGPATETVILHGRLPAWVLKELCKRAPSLRIILTAPWTLKQAKNNHPSAIRICEEKQIKEVLDCLEQNGGTLIEEVTVIKEDIPIFKLPEKLVGKAQEQWKDPEEIRIGISSQW